MSLLDLKHIRKRYSAGRLALDDVSISIDRGELVAILGTSGSGKSTLLNVLGALDLDHEGECVIDGRAVKSLDDSELAALRQKTFGYVFQGFHLVPTWRVRQNVALPASFAPEAVKGLHARVDEVLARVGLEGRGDDLPSALSGGQRQRVAIARALLLKAPVLLCDEPTGSLDATTGDSVLKLFASLHREEGITVVIVTHETRATDIAHRVVRIESGKVVEDQARTPGGGP